MKDSSKNMLGSEKRTFSKTSTNKTETSTSSRRSLWQKVFPCCAELGEDDLHQNNSNQSDVKNKYGSAKRKNHTSSLNHPRTEISYGRNSLMEYKSKDKHSFCGNAETNNANDSTAAQEDFDRRKMKNTHSLNEIETNNKEEISGNIGENKLHYRLMKTLGLDFTSSLLELPKNEPFFLRSANLECFAIARLSEVHFKFSKRKKQAKSVLTPAHQKSQSKDKTVLTYDNRRQNLFKLYDKGIIFDIESEYFVTPERVARHIAKKARHMNLIVDAFCGVGGNTIQFAKEGLFVIAIDINDNKVKFTKNNCQIYGVSDRVEFIRTDFFDIRNIQADLVFLNPAWEPPKDLTEKFSIFQHVQPDIRVALRKALKISTNICLLLPKFTDLKELALLFGELQREAGPSRRTNTYLEIDAFFFNKRVEHIVVYYGEMTKLKPEDEMGVLLKFLNTERYESQKVDIRPLIEHIVKRCGSVKTIELLFEAEEIFQESKNQTMIQSLVEILMKNDFTQEEIHEIISEEKYRQVLDFYNGSGDTRSPLTFDLKHIDKFSHNDKYFGGCRKEDFSFESTKQTYYSSKPAKNTNPGKTSVKPYRDLIQQEFGLQFEDLKTPSYGKKPESLSEAQEESLALLSPSIYSKNIPRSSENSDEDMMEYQMSMDFNNPDHSFPSEEDEAMKNKSFENCLSNNYSFYDKNVHSLRK